VIAQHNARLLSIKSITVAEDWDVAEQSTTVKWQGNVLAYLDVKRQRTISGQAANTFVWKSLIFEDVGVEILEHDILAFHPHGAVAYAQVKEVEVNVPPSGIIGVPVRVTFEEQ
jgi:hypothetical protein